MAADVMTINAMGLVDRLDGEGGSVSMFVVVVVVMVVRMSVLVVSVVDMTVVSVRVIITGMGMLLRGNGSGKWFQVR